MKWAWHSNSPWCGTGYGQQTALVLPRLLERAGEGNVACISNFGLSGASMTMGGVTHFPTGLHPYSDDIAAAHAEHWFAGDPGWVITLFDVWVWSNRKWLDLNVASWTPIDHDPVPPQVLRWFTEFGAVPMTYSRHGQAAMTAAGLDPIYVPHAIDTTLWAPGARAEGREILGVPDDVFLVGMVAANKGNTPPRKGWAEAFRAVAATQRFHDDLWFYTHTDVIGSASGVDLMALANHVDLDPDRWRYPDPYTARATLPADVMVAITSAFDVLLAPSYGEGFGLPVLEAQACGVPVVVTNATAQPELVGAGWTVEGQRLYDPALGADFTVPNIEEVAYALHLAHERDTDTVTADALEARALAVNYDIGTVWDEYWTPALDQLEERTANREPIRAAAL
jgi:glycosyltransferase involved in cell wall biosynthesis